MRLFAAAASWLGDIIDNIVGVFTDLGTAILNFIKDGFVSLFLTTSVSDGVTTITGVSPLGIMMFILVGISLTIGLTRLIFGLVKHTGH